MCETGVLLNRFRGPILIFSFAVIGPRLVNKVVGYVEINYHVSVILVRHDHETEMHPTDSKKINSGDVLAVLAGPDELSKIMYANG